MALLTDLPAELRQQIIRLLPGSVPAEVRLDHHRWPDPVNQLLITCKLLRADAVQVMSTWSFDCLISRSAFIERLPRLIRAIKALGLENKVQKIRLLVWSSMGIGRIRHPLSPLQQEVDSIESIVTKWIEHLTRLPRGDIKTVIVDATPLPQHMTENRPQVVNANLRLPRTSGFLRNNRGAVSDIMLHLNQHFNPALLNKGEDETDVIEEPPDPGPLTRLILGGRFGEGCRSTIEAILNDSGISTTPKKSDASAFVGNFCDSDIPPNLSLYRLAQKCGIHISTGGLGALLRLDISGITLLGDAQTNEIDPDKDFSALSPLAFSASSATAFYVSALEDEKDSRAAVIKLLTFALDSRQSPGVARRLDFLPVPAARKKLVHELCNDLGLAHSTVEDHFRKFVRVSSSLDDKIGHPLSSRWNPSQSTTKWTASLGST